MTTKADHIKAASLAIDAYCAETGTGEYAVRDLLSDLMHYCEKNGIDFDEELEMARSHYADECKNEVQS